MLCDGIPYARGMLSKSLNNYTKTATVEAQKQGVTIIAIGFGESKVAEIFHNHVALASIGQMEDTVLSVVKEVLRASQTGSKRTMVGGAGVRV